MTLAPYPIIIIPYCHSFKKNTVKIFLDVEMFWVTTPLSIFVFKRKMRFDLPGPPLFLGFRFYRQSNRINHISRFSFLRMLYTTELREFL